jgi:hypothetical protein
MQVVERASVEQLRRGEVVEITESGSVIVMLDGESASIRCDTLVTTEAAPPLMVEGDRVLAWISADQSAVVLGRIGPTRGAITETSRPDVLTLEAKQSLTLRVGEGSITIRDGRVLIKGKDLVSHAQRTNRIKGGAVSIN